jgi:hypothetical protein
MVQGGTRVIPQPAQSKARTIDPVSHENTKLQCPFEPFSAIFTILPAVATFYKTLFANQLLDDILTLSK